MTTKILIIILEQLSQIKKDIAEGVDVLFLPDTQIINIVKFAFRLGHISRKLCGVDRSGHFEGVAKIILKFLQYNKTRFYIYI